jgi:type IX secretion system PorP/SprF family membrane protein
MWRLIVDRVKRKKLIVNLGIVLLFTTYGYAQQEPIFNGYLFNQFIINPACANADGVINGSLYARNQWGGFNGAPNTQSISVHGPLGIAQKNGFGIQCINEQIGSFKTFKSMASYSYKINLSIGYLCLGLRGGIINYTIDKSKLDYKDASDPRSLQLMNNMLLPNFDAGLYYYSNNYFVSLSCNQLVEKSFFTTNNLLSQQLKRHYYFMSAYYFNAGQHLKIKPSFLIKYVYGAKINADLNLNLIIKNRISTGFTYRNSGSIAFLIVGDVNEKLRIGYSYEHILNPIQSYVKFGAHELFLNFRLSTSKKVNRIANPRF